MSSLLSRHGAKIAVVLAILAFAVLALSLFWSADDSAEQLGKRAVLARNSVAQQSRQPEIVSAPPPIAFTRKSVVTEPAAMFPQTQMAGGSIADGEERRLAILDSLQEAATTYSPDGIPLIEPSLYASDREIREAAADALVVLGETGGAKALRKAAAKSRDPREAIALIERAEFLELPRATLSPRDKQPAAARATTPSRATAAPFAKPPR